MVVHELGGRVRVARGYGIADVVMIAVHCGAELRRGPVPHEPGPQNAEHRSGDHLQQPVARRLHDCDVEVLVPLEVRGQIDFGARVQRGLEALEPILVATQGRQSGRGHLDQLASLEDLIDRHHIRARQEPDGGLQVRLDMLRGGFGDECAAVHAALGQDQALR